MEDEERDWDEIVECGDEEKQEEEEHEEREEGEIEGADLRILIGIG